MRPAIRAARFTGYQPPERLCLYEEIMLLALSNEKGRLETAYLEYTAAGAILAELSLGRRISIEANKKQLVSLENPNPTQDPVIDECLQKIATAKRRASLRTWVSRLAGIKELRHKIARQLCNRGVLRADEDRVLFFFTRKNYPEIDPMPEKRIVERMRAAIFADGDQVDPRTVVLISLANGAGLLKKPFGAKELKSRKKRIEQIVNGELTGKATQEVIAACQAAVMVAAIMPATIAATSD
jgi:hypothetical protein